MAAPPYPKIENLYARKADGKRLDVGVLRRPETPLIARWLATEKIDGTNIRVSLEEAAGPPSSTDWEVDFYGRTNKADIPDFLEDYLVETLPLEKVSLLWRGLKQCPKCKGWGLIAVGGVLPDMTITDERCPCVEPYPIILYGEGYGARIQRGGGDYRKNKDVSFRLFDVLVADKFWLTWENVVSVAKRLGIKTVPIVPGGQSATQEDIVDFVRDGFKSLVAEDEGTPRLAEGIVARTDPYLFDNNGRRVVFKTKTKDF